MSHCPDGECVSGSIAGKQVLQKDWEREFWKFEGKIELFNELTKTRQIPHIGFVVPARFCVLCGRPLFVTNINQPTQG